MTSNKTFQYDIMISYSHVDEEFVKNTLLPRLENQGLKVCIDYRDFIPSKLITKEIERCILSSKHILTIFTNAYRKSDWCDFESIIGQSLDINASDSRIIPLLLEDCDIPLRFKNIIYLDFRDHTKWENELGKLLNIFGIKRNLKEIERKKSSTILIIDDEEKWLDTLTNIVIEEGFKVETANNYYDAHKRIIMSQDKFTAFNLVACVIDLGLAGNDNDVDGLGLLSQCKISNIPTIAISSSRIESLRKSLSSEYGVVQSFNKTNFSIDEFISTLNKIS